MNKFFADFGLIFVGFLWGLGFIATKVGLNEGISPLYMVTLRFLISTLFYSLIFFKEFKYLKKKEIFRFTILAIIFFAAFYLQTIGSKYTSASKAAFYTGVNVLFVPYVSWMLHRKAPDIYTYFSTLICISGVGIISYIPGENLFQINMGDALVILSAVLFGIHLSLLGYFAKKYKSDRIVLVQSIATTIICLIFMILTKDKFKILTNLEFASILYLGIVSTGICVFLQTFFQKFTSSVRASIFLTTESVFAPIFAYFLLNEKLTNNVYLGGLLIILAILLSETRLGIDILINKIRRQYEIFKSNDKNI